MLTMSLIHVGHGYRPDHGVASTAGRADSRRQGGCSVYDSPNFVIVGNLGSAIG